MDKLKLLFCLLILMFASCKNDVDRMSSNEGIIDINVNATNSTLEVDSRALSDVPDVGDFSLELKNSKDELVKTWERFSDFAPVSVGVDSYVVSAFYGDKTQEGFDALSYFGSTEVQVNENQNTEASIVCSINKALVSISYTEAFKNYFSDYSAYIETSVQGRRIEYVKTESRSAYFVPGDLKVFLLVERNGVNGEIKLNPKNFTAQVQTEYRLTMDVDASTATLRIIFNDNPANVENVEINISDSSLNSDPPVVMCTGFENGVEKEVLESSLITDKLQMFLNAQAGLSSCSMEIQSDYLNGLGWPTSLELTNITEEQKVLIDALNLKLLGFGENKDKMAVIDFASFVSNLECVSEGDDIHTFTVTATDNLTKISEPVVLKIKTRNNKFSFTKTENLVPYFASEVDFDMTLEGDHNEVSFEEFVSGSYVKIDPSRITVTPQEGSINSKVVINYTSPLVDTESEMKVKATIGSKSKEVLFRVDAPDLTLSLKNGDADVWAAKAYLNVVASPKSRASRTISASTVEIQYKNGENWEKWPNQSFDENKGFTLTGLDGMTQYTVRAVYYVNSEIVSVSNEVSITTEEKKQIPNSGFEDWYSEMVWEKTIFLSGGEKIYSFYPFANGDSDSWWSTSNVLTTQKLGDASWYYCAYSSVIPTNSSQTHTSLWHVSNHGKPSDFGVSSITVDNSFDGNTSMEITSIGYGKNNWTSQSSAQEGCQKHTSGALFIGTFDLSSYNNDTQDIESGMSLGHTFNSRPTGLKFAYKFYPYKSGQSKAYIRVYDSNKSEIGYGDVIISDATDTFNEITIDVDYIENSPKASYITVVFLSSSDIKPQTLAIQGSKGAINSGYGDSRHIGNILTVDNVELIYE